MAAERARRRLRDPALGLLVVAMLVGLLPLLSAQRPVLALALLAQPALAIGIAALLAGVAWRRKLPGFVLLWTAYALAYALFALLLGWPLARIAAAPGSATAMFAGLAAGVGLYVLWRHGTVYVHLAGGGDRLASLRAAAAVQPARVPGLALALPLMLLFASGAMLLLAGPALDDTLRRLLASVHLAAGALAAVAAIALRPRAQVSPADARAALDAQAEPPGESAVPATVDAPHHGGRSREGVASVAAAKVVPGALDEDALESALDAARRGESATVLAALAAGLDPDARPPPEDRDQRSLAVLAAVMADLQVLRALIAAGCDLNRADAGLTPLLAATRDSWHGRPEAVMTLLTNGADPRVADSDGRTPLHHAARSSDPGVAALLLDAGAVLEALDHERVSPLGAACAAGNWRLARFLLERGARTDPEGGQPAIVAAVAGDDDAAGVGLLLRHGATVDARGDGDATALLVASAAGHAETVQALIEAGADRNAADATGMTPLLAAARAGHLAVLRQLVHPGLDVTACDHEGRTALALACSAPTAGPELLRLLLDLGLDPGQRDGAGRRPIDIAIAAGRWRLVVALDPRYPLPATLADPRERGGGPGSPRKVLAAALAERRFEAAAATLAIEPGTATLLPRLLLEHSTDADIDVFRWLLANGADVDSAAARALGLPLRILDGGGRSERAVQRLLERGVHFAGAGGLARWLSACLAADTPGEDAQRIALRLLEGGADPFAAAPGGDVPLVLAIRLGWQRLAGRLLADGVDPNSRDARGATALHLACGLGRESAVRLLVRHGASPAARAPDGQTPLGMALATNRQDLAPWLQWPDWPLPTRPMRDADLPAAAMLGDLAAVERLLDLGLPVDGVDAQGCTALLRAAGGGHAELVARLLDAGANPSHTARTGATPLSAAVSMRQTDIVAQLLRRGAEVDQGLPGGVTPLMVAAALGLPDMCARLLAAGAGIERRDGQGYTAMHCAALFAFGARERQRVIALIDTLLLGGACADVASEAGHTPLLLALGVRAEPGTGCDEEVVLAAIEALLREEVSLEVQDQRGVGPLHLAAMHGLLRVAQRLLHAGADPGRRDGDGRSPSDVAMLRGFVDIAAQFEPLRSNVSLARFLRKPD